MIKLQSNIIESLKSPIGNDLTSNEGSPNIVISNGQINKSFFDNSH